MKTKTNRNLKGQFLRCENRKEIFISRILNYGDKTKCWLWQGNINPNGYGRFRFNNKTMSTHRLSYELFVDKIPPKICVLHKCDNPKCVNPLHLFLGTLKDNTDDMMRKNRNFFKKNEIPSHFLNYVGDKHPRAKITTEQVKEIKLKLKIKYNRKQMAQEYGISLSAIKRIQSGRNWKNVK